MTSCDKPGANPTPESAPDQAQELAALKAQVAKLERALSAQQKISKVLMDRSEHSVNDSGNAYALFAQNLSLQKNVEGRTLELRKVNEELRGMVEVTRQARKVAELRGQEARQALEELRATQEQLIKAEKMASLGQLVANMAHKINTPIGAIKSSGKNIAEGLEYVIRHIPKLFSHFDRQSRDLFIDLLSKVGQPALPRSTREERVLKRETARKLEALDIKHSYFTAGILIQLHAYELVDRYLPLLHHPESKVALDIAHRIASLIQNSDNINDAVEQLSRLIASLRVFSNLNSPDQRVWANVADELDAVLAAHRSQMQQNVTLVRHYERVPKLHCAPNELSQLWSHLIHNALQAMEYAGTLTVSIRQTGEEVMIAINDTGCGIPDALHSKVFDPFFTTKPTGEGGGIGLDIASKIVARHAGRIALESQVGTGTTIFVYLPLPKLLDQTNDLILG
jgi:two-component system, NtrC family, sensor kinase